LIILVSKKILKSFYILNPFSTYCFWSV